MILKIEPTIGGKNVAMVRHARLPRSTVPRSIVLIAVTVPAMVLMGTSTSLARISQDGFAAIQALKVAQVQSGFRDETLHKIALWSSVGCVGLAALLLALAGIITACPYPCRAEPTAAVDKKGRRNGREKHLEPTFQPRDQSAGHLRRRKKRDRRRREDHREEPQRVQPLRPIWPYQPAPPIEHPMWGLTHQGRKKRFREFVDEDVEEEEARGCDWSSPWQVQPAPGYMGQFPLDNRWQNPPHHGRRRDRGQRKAHRRNKKKAKKRKKKKYHEDLRRHSLKSPWFPLFNPCCSRKKAQLSRIRESQMRKQVVVCYF